MNKARNLEPTMSSPLSHSPPAHEGAASNDTGSQTQPDAAAAAKDQLWAFISSIRTPADGKCFDALGPDGVWRVLQYLPTPPNQPSVVSIYDAKPMPAELIKVYLDTLPWSQEREERFRGVDGRDVPEE
jgi:hypothetical protein